MRAKTVLRARRSVLAGIQRRRFTAAQQELKRRHSAQRDAWAVQSRDFLRVVDSLSAFADPRFVQPDWVRNQRELESLLIPSPPFDFLSSTVLQDTMVMVTGGRRFDHELRVCRTTWGPQSLGLLAEEDLAGEPILHSRDPLTSHTRIHHLHSLARHEQACGPGLATASVCLEWGGGFGGMARVMRRFARADQTLIVVDLPIMSALQWIYLTVTLGPDAVHLIDRPGAGTVPGRVNIVPNGLLGEITVRPDAFISTWGLGESEPAAHDVCRGRGWLDARHLIVADQHSGKSTQNSDKLLAIVAGPDTVTEPVRTVPGSRFVFR